MDQQLSLFGFEDEPVKPHTKKVKSIEKEEKESSQSVLPTQDNTLQSESSDPGEAKNTVITSAPNDNDPDTAASKKEDVTPVMEEVQNSNVPSETSVHLEKETSSTDHVTSGIETVPAVPLPSDDNIISADKKEEEVTPVSGITVIRPIPPKSQEIIFSEDKEEEFQKINLANKRGRKSFEDIDKEVDLIQVPKDEILYKKQYYSISQVAKWFRVNNSLIRFWENEFSILKPRKNRKGDRLFRPEDIKNLQIIYYLLRQKKYTIDGARKYLKENQKNLDLQMQLLQTLNEFKEFLLELRANTTEF